MSVFAHPEYDQHEKVVFHQDPTTGLKAIIAVHNRNLGPALGGCRMWPYASDDEALTDVLRLSRGMTYKAAIANLKLGGGKSVIIGDSRADKTPEKMQAMGRLINSLSGHYCCAEDVGIGVEDVHQMARETDYVCGFDKADKNAGDPSPYTAYGVFVGIRSAVKFRLGRDDLKGLTVAVQGVGKVGYNLVQHLCEAGAHVKVSDIYAPNVERAVQNLGVEAVALNDIHRIPADVLAPCAMGAVLNAETIPQLQADIVAGAANNQLALPEDGRALADRDILYVPDYALNAGGLIEVYYQYIGGDKQKVKAHIDQVAMETLPHIFAEAKTTGMPTNEVADNLARKRFMG